jgi:hypothetical protein
MKLIKEFIDFDNMEVLKEEVEIDGKKDHILRLKGPFLEAKTKNKNGRVYPMDLIEREVKYYKDEKIKKNRAVGTCDHEDSPQISLDRISHIIESLEMKDNLAIGVARVIDTPTGKILKTLVKEGIVLGMSSRGIGELEEDGTVKSSYKLLGIDAVLDNSGPSCFVEGILESKDYYIDGDKIVERAVENLKRKVDNKYNPKYLSNNTLQYMLEFINDLSVKKI